MADDSPRKILEDLCTWDGDLDELDRLIKRAHKFNILVPPRDRINMPSWMNPDIDLNDIDEEDIN